MDASPFFKVGQVVGVQFLGRASGLPGIPFEPALRSVPGGLTDRNDPPAVGAFTRRRPPLAGDLEPTAAGAVKPEVAITGRVYLLGPDRSAKPNLGTALRHSIRSGASGRDFQFFATPAGDREA